MIEVRKLRKTYKHEDRQLAVVDEVDFRCAKGDYISIVGHSGSGKTTFLSLLGGLTRPDAGEIIIDATNLADLPDRQLAAFRNRKLNFIFQFASLIPTLSVLENVMLPSVFRPAGDQAPAPGQTRREALDLLAVVGLADRADTRITRLSGGQQRRVAIARAFINQPEIILADEPTGDLDEETEGEIIALFARMNRERGTTFIVVTHNATVAAAADTTLRMTNGRFSGSDLSH